MTQRFRSGGTLLANYSWSTFLSTTNSATSQVEIHTQGVIQDNTNLRAERSYLSFDVPHRFVVSHIIDLPLGDEKKLLNNAGNLVSALVGG